MGKWAIFLALVTMVAPAWAAGQGGKLVGAAARSRAISAYLRAGGAGDGLGRIIDVTVPLSQEVQARIFPSMRAAGPLGPDGPAGQGGKPRPSARLEPPVSAAEEPEPAGHPAVREEPGRGLEGERVAGQVQFDHAAWAPFLASLKGGLRGAQEEAGPGLPLEPPVGSLAWAGGRYWINGKPAALIGFGSFKHVLLHPQDSRFAVKVFNARLTRDRSLEFKREEVGKIRILEPLDITPRFFQQGAVRLDGRAIGFMVAERVEGETLERPASDKLRHVRALFDRLIEARLEIADLNPRMLRSNLMVGRAASGGWKAWLVNAGVVGSAKGRQELKAFYEKVYSRLASRQ